jgi:hypothetical protein
VQNINNKPSMPNKSFLSLAERKIQSPKPSYSRKYYNLFTVIQLQHDFRGKCTKWQKLHPYPISFCNIVNCLYYKQTTPLPTIYLPKLCIFHIHSRMKLYTDFLFLTLTILVFKVKSGDPSSVLLTKATYIGKSHDCLSRPDRTKYFYGIQQEVSSSNILKPIKPLNCYSNYIKKICIYSRQLGSSP